MGMHYWADISLKIYDAPSDCTKIIERSFIGDRARVAGDFNGKIERYDNHNYHISYYDFRYYEGREIEDYSTLLAEAVPQSTFELKAILNNEGSAGDYTDYVWVSYKKGILSYKYSCGYEQENGPSIDNLTINEAKKFNEYDTNNPEIRAIIERDKAVSIDFTNKVFVSTGLDATDETFVRQTVESAGGIYKSKFVKSIDYLIYNPYYNRETSKMKDAKVLKAEGKKIEILTLEAFKNSVSDGVASDEDEYVIAVPMEIGIGEKTYEFTMNFSVTRVNREDENAETDTDKTYNTNSSSGSSISDYLKKFSELEIDYTTGTLNKMPITLGGKVIIPDGVKVIAENACKSCTAEEILLPDGLVKIEANAFEMGRMKKIVLPDSLESIGKRAFEFCEALTEIKLPVNIKTLKHEILRRYVGG